MSTRTSDLPPWDPSNFYFDLPGSIPQCSNATWDYMSINTANPLPKPPYYGVFYTGGYEPYKIQFRNRDLTGSLNWTANLPLDLTFGASMFDSEHYTSGMLERTIKMTAQPGCNVTNPLTPSTLDVEVTGNSGQCQMSWVNIKNGTPPYKLEIAPLGRHQKTIHFMTSPLGFVLDMGAGLDYWLAVYDSAGRAAVMGSYSVSVTSDTACLEAASTITAGKFSTMYPGGTTTFTTSATAAATSAPSHELAKPTIIGIAVGVSIVAIAIAALLMWFCYKRYRRRNGLEEKSNIEPVYVYPGVQYTPVPMTGTSLTFAESQYAASNSGYYSPPIASPYSLPPTASGNRNSIHTVGGVSTAEHSSTGFSEKRRHLVNSDPHNLGGIYVEPFDPNSLSGSSNVQSEPPLSPPAYSASSR
ncbi:hypothetical protein RSOLAG1IB_04872 [Rhizoctonia solani AG-1 IB]|uniref:Alphaherpesvirus glycoprotein E domain-containing protein n=1 Tax=Thanatephorus cucumeris (strain AG1-IB / isolate 7/3/14) TaxID=1108050 RepID=A0A0B7FX50_THACB|nr:hypothetical protein RSOLAG1IB_04872 [Rhizoctonia solani AG-1 IB]